MCELFGVSSREKVNCTQMLREFFSRGHEHPHGWGIGFYEESALTPLVVKEAVASIDSDMLQERLKSPIRRNLLLAHIRLATKGSIEFKNTHPFFRMDATGRFWTLIHNGTVFECDRLSKYVKKQEGQTDSERILLYMIDCINQAARRKRFPLSEEERYALIDRMVKAIAPENKINLIITDGNDLYVHTNVRGGLHKKKEGDTTAIFSTRPLDDGEWEELPLNTLLVYRKGEEVYQGTAHDYEFFETEEKMRYLFLDYAGI